MMKRPVGFAVSSEKATRFLPRQVDAAQNVSDAFVVPQRVMGFWTGKVALVTGGSSGLGYSIAQAFLDAGASVILIARDEQRLMAAAQALRQADSNQLYTRCCDVTRDSEVDSLAQWLTTEIGRLDVLVNNVGRSQRGLALETSLDEYRTLWETNFLATVRCTQVFAPLIRESRGHVVNIGSLASKVATPYLGSYPSSKFPVAAFSQQLRLELGPTGIHVLLVCPGPIQRQDSGRRYHEQSLAQGLPEHASRPGGGVRLSAIDPGDLAKRIIRACERRSPELTVPGKARWLFALCQLFPRLGDWILRKKTRS